MAKLKPLYEFEVDGADDDNMITLQVYDLETTIFLHPNITDLVNLVQTAIDGLADIARYRQERNFQLLQEQYPRIKKLLDLEGAFDAKKLLKEPHKSKVETNANQPTEQGE